MNIVTLHGRMARDAEMRTSQAGKAFARFTVAVDRAAKNEERAADFISCVAFGRSAELIGNYFPKGKEILLEGHIQTGSYEAKDGTKRYTVDVIVDRVEFCGSKGDSKPQDGGGYAGGKTEHWTPTDDDIPF